jgi:hypothetical protein
MNGTRTMLAVVLALLLVVSALPVAAASYNSGPINVQKNNTKGGAASTLTPIHTSFCFLSSVAFEDLDSGGETARCRVYRGSSNWVVEAYLNRSDDHDAWCSAICYNNY